MNMKIVRVLVADLEPGMLISRLDKVYEVLQSTPSIRMEGKYYVKLKLVSPSLEIMTVSFGRGGVLDVIEISKPESEEDKVETVDTHWDCNCKKDYIHLKSESCKVCGDHYHMGFPDSRKDEVEKHEKGIIYERIIRNVEFLLRTGVIVSDKYSEAWVIVDSESMKKIGELFKSHCIAVIGYEKENVTAKFLLQSNHGINLIGHNFGE